MKNLYLIILTLFIIGCSNSDECNPNIQGTYEVAGSNGQSFFIFTDSERYIKVNGDYLDTTNYYNDCDVICFENTSGDDCIEYSNSDGDIQLREIYLIKQ